MDSFFIVFYEHYCLVLRWGSVVGVVLRSNHFPTLMNDRTLRIRNKTQWWPPNEKNGPNKNSFLLLFQQILANNRRLCGIRITFAVCPFAFITRLPHRFLSIHFALTIYIHIGCTVHRTFNNQTWTFHLPFRIWDVFGVFGVLDIQPHAFIRYKN